jgi:PilZ domain
MKLATNWFRKLSDHRRAQRLKSPLLVAFYWNGAAPKPHDVQDISSTGFYLLTQERWPPGTIITMTLQRTSSAPVKSGEENHISVRSKVIRADKDGVGFTFILQEPEINGPNSGPAGKKAINRFLDQLKSDRGHAMIENLEAVLKTKLSTRSGSAFPGEPYEETEG